MERPLVHIYSDGSCAPNPGPGGWAAVKALLLAVFDVDVSPLERRGGRDRTLMSSAWFDGSGRCVANLSAFAMPLLIDRRPVEAAGLQSGAVLPEYRGRGLFRALLRRTLQRCEERRGLFQTERLEAGNRAMHRCQF